MSTFNTVWTRIGELLQDDPEQAKTEINEYVSGLTPTQQMQLKQHVQILAQIVVPAQERSQA